MSQKFDMDKWTIEAVRGVVPGHLSGWLINKATGNRYVFSIQGDKISYMREPKPPTNIPHYVGRYLLEIREQLKGPGLRRRF